MEFKIVPDDNVSHILPALQELEECWTNSNNYSNHALRHVARLNRVILEKYGYINFKPAISKLKEGEEFLYHGAKRAGYRNRFSEARKLALDILIKEGRVSIEPIK